MATITQITRTRDAAGIRARRVVSVTGPASYATGGDPFAPNLVFLGEIEYFPSEVALDAAGITPRIVRYDYTNLKLKWFVPNTGAEVADTTDLSAYTFRVEVIGKG